MAHLLHSRACVTPVRYAQDPVRPYPCVSHAWDPVRPCVLPLSGGGDAKSLTRVRALRCGGEYTILTVGFTLTPAEASEGVTTRLRAIPPKKRGKKK